MKSYKIIDSIFSGKTSYVTIKSKKGETYTGVSTVAKEDEDFVSKLAGCRYAKEKAIIKMLKAERLEAIKECEAIRKFVKSLQNYKNFDKKSKTAKCVYRQLNCRIKQVNKLTTEISERIFMLQQDFAKQDIINKKIRDKGVKNGNYKTNR